MTRHPQYVYEYSPCKAIAHDWDATPNQRRASWGSLLTLRCSCCGSVREDTYDSNGNLSTRNYIYNDWFCEMPSMTKAQWRQIYFTYMKRSGQSRNITHSLQSSHNAEVVPMRSVI